MCVRFDVDALDDAEPFEVDRQVAHVFKHPHLGVDDVMDVWNSDPLFYPAKPPAHWLMLAEVGGRGSHRPNGPIPLGRSGQVSTDRLLRGIFAPCHPLPKGPR